MTKIFTFDIETAPHLAHVWGVWKANVQPEMIGTETYVLSWAGKWLNQKRTISASLPDFKSYAKQPENDKALIQSLVHQLNDADIVVGHNIRRFDLSIINARCLVHGIARPTPAAVIDTLEVAKSFRFPHKSLKGLAKSLNLDSQKGDPGGINTWMDIIRDRDPAAWDRMVKYNRLDVEVNEQLYLKMRPWIKNHPAVEAFGCPVCGSTEFVKKQKPFHFGGIPRQVHSCKDCGGLYFLFNNGRAKSI
jgi:hypothetical protein